MMNSPLCLLIADDEQLERDAIELLVNRTGLPVTCLKAKNGKEAIAMSQANRPQIAFLDIKMPGIDGIGAAKCIKEDNPSCLIVFLTAWSSFDFAQEAVRVGASDYLVKPVDEQHLVTLLKKLIDEIDHRNNTYQRVMQNFSREFFSSLKYGGVPESSLRNYLVNQGITMESGVALVLGEMQEADVLPFFSDSRPWGATKVCSFVALDRVTALVFSRSPVTFLEKFLSYVEQHHCPFSSVGASYVFSSLSGIKEAIFEASCVFAYASDEGKRTARFSDIPQQFNHQVSLYELVHEISATVEEGSLSSARRQAHAMIDEVCLRSSSPEQMSDMLYDLVLVCYVDLHRYVQLLSLEKPERGSSEMLENYLMDLLDTVAGSLSPMGVGRYDRSFSLLRKYIDEHYGENLGPEKAAQMVGINTKYFSRLCKEYLGMGFIEYLTAKRMEKAKELLESGQTVKEVSSSTGFSDPNYFTRVFRHAFGLSPSEYRKR